VLSHDGNERVQTVLPDEASRVHQPVRFAPEVLDKRNPRSAPLTWRPVYLPSRADSGIAGVLLPAAERADETRHAPIIPLASQMDGHPMHIANAVLPVVAGGR
jgi:hypothetical protein